MTVEIEADNKGGGEAKTPRQAFDKLGLLHIDYCPLLDQLANAWQAPDTVGPIIDDEVRRGEEIGSLGMIAFGTGTGATLVMMKPDPGEIEEIALVPLLSEDHPLWDEHRISLIACCVRSKRLGDLLKKGPIEAEVRQPAVLPPQLAQESEMSSVLGPMKQPAEPEDAGQEDGASAPTDWDQLDTDFTEWASAQKKQLGRPISRAEAEEWAMSQKVGRDWGRNAQKRLPSDLRRGPGQPRNK